MMLTHSTLVLMSYKKCIYWSNLPVTINWLMHTKSEDIPLHYHTQQGSLKLMFGYVAPFISIGKKKHWNCELGMLSTGYTPLVYLKWGKAGQRKGSISSIKPKTTPCNDSITFDGHERSKLECSTHH